jgi:hypothetical protein
MKSLIIIKLKPYFSLPKIYKNVIYVFKKYIVYNLFSNKFLLFFTRNCIIIKRHKIFVFYYVYIIYPKKLTQKKIYQKKKFP